MAAGFVEGVAGFTVGAGVTDGADGFDDGVFVGAGVSVAAGVVGFDDGVVVGAGVSVAAGAVEGAAVGAVVGAGVAAGVSVGAAVGVTEALFSEELSSPDEVPCFSVDDFSSEEAFSSVEEADDDSLRASVSDDSEAAGASA